MAAPRPVGTFPTDGAIDTSADPLPAMCLATANTTLPDTYTRTLTELAALDPCLAR